MRKENQLKKKYTIWPFITVCAVAYILMYILFRDSMWTSDTIVHNIFVLRWITDGTGLDPVVTNYPLYHIIMRGLFYVVAKIANGPGIDINIISCYFLATINIVNVIVMRMLLNYIVRAEKTIEKYAVDFLSLASIVFMGIGTFLTNGRYYAIQGAPNAWHNPTLILVRPIGILSIYFFLKCLEKAEKNETFISELVAFSLITLVSCFAKPSYAFVFLPGMGIYVLILLFKDFKRNLKKIGIPMLLAAMPSVVVLLLQFIGISSNSNKMSGVHIYFGGEFRISFWQAVGGTISVMGLIIFVFILLGKKLFLKEPSLAISFFASVVGWFQFYFLVRTGVATGDFFWGYALATNLATIVSVALMAKYEEKKALKVAGVVVFLFQLLNGFIYCYLMIRYGRFWV